MSNFKNCRNGSALRTIKRLAALIGLFSATAAFAVPDSGGLTPQAPVATCIVNSPSTLNFGERTSLGRDPDQLALIQVMCTKTTPYSIALDAGADSGVSFARHQMVSGAAAASYSLHSDTTHSAVWGGVIGVDASGATASGRRRNHMIYGRMASQVSPASRSDTITVTVTY